MARRKSSLTTILVGNGLVPELYPVMDIFGTKEKLGLLTVLDGNLGMVNHFHQNCASFTTVVNVESNLNSLESMVSAVQLSAGSFAESNGIIFSGVL